MRKRKLFPVIFIALALVLLLAVIVVGRGRSTFAPEPGAPVSDSGNVGAAEAVGASEPGAEPGKRDGERFEAVIILEGMEETVRYEHARNDAIGFEMDYDYDLFVRQSAPDRERFVSCWDEADSSENYLEVRYDPRDAETVAAAIGAVLSNDYEISRDDSFPLERAGRCIRIDASADVGGLTMPEQLQMVYIIPAADGCRVATAHYAIEGSEGFGRRFRYFMDTFAVIDSRGENTLSDEQALAAVRRYCLIGNPDLESLANTGGATVYWEVESSDASGIVVLFRSYTGALIRYYIDPVSGETTVTEFVSGISSVETQTDERLNVRDYL